MGLITNQTQRRAIRGARGLTIGWWVCFVLLSSALPAGADPLEDARDRLRAGDYPSAVVLGGAGLSDRPGSEDWQLLMGEALLSLGRYAEARAVITNALARESRSIRLRWFAREVFLSNGDPRSAAQMIDETLQLVSSRAWAYREAPDLVAFGRAALVKGADPKQVLTRVYEAAKKADPASREVHLAIGELALEKHDYALAAKAFQEGLKRLPKDADLHFGLARAYAPSARSLMVESLEAALTNNSNHLASLLLVADHRIDREDYDEATKLLSQVRAINPWHPEAWAAVAVIAHLRNQPAVEQVAREMALRHWPTNPRVPHLIGRKLSQKYRFAEGAALQREALAFDPAYLPAKAQLAQDLLRLGEETEGWRLATEVQEEDGYDVTANNLVTLHDTMSHFQTLTNRHFVVRMHASEAPLYGGRVLELLEEARVRLGAAYGLELTRPVLVEFFHEQKDFAVRTFGMPENHGFLGVCFGEVVTANSPASRPGQRFNWESMLWHEFCHVITLQLTRNKMPRWLSEGISVYEERQANSAWGEQMTPRYREMILGDELTPVAQLSGAFLAPPSAAHLQFAYYQSSLVVEFLVERFGPEALRAVLRDLGEGAEMYAALVKHTAPMATLEKDFATFARELAKGLAPALDWQKPDLRFAAQGLDSEAWTQWALTRPQNFWVMTRQAKQFIEDRDWAKARPVLMRLIEAYPGFVGSDSPYRQLGLVHRELGETDQEREALARLAERDDEAVDAYLRLMELGSAAGDWAAVVLNARRYLAVDPLVAPPYRFLAEAGEQTGEPAQAIRAWRALLQLDPANPAEIHFRLARQLHQIGDPGARRHLLQSLEDAPRHREALRLLIDMTEPRTADLAVPGQESPSHP